MENTLQSIVHERCAKDELPEMLKEIAEALKAYAEERREELYAGYADKTDAEREADRPKWDNEFYLSRTFSNVERIAGDATENRLYRDRTPAEREAASREAEIARVERQLEYLKRK